MFRCEVCDKTHKCKCYDKKPKKIKEAYFLWYYEKEDMLFELTREVTNDLALLKAMNNFKEFSSACVLIGLIEVKYK